MPPEKKTAPHPPSASQPGLTVHGEMSWTISLSAEGDYVQVETHGIFTVVGFQSMLRAIVGQPYWRPDCPLLVDHRDLNMSAVNFNEMLVAGSVHRGLDEQIGKCPAAIVLRDLADFGTAQMYDGATRAHVQARLRYYTDMDEAREWVEQQARIRDDETLPPDVHGHFAV